MQSAFYIYHALCNFSRARVVVVASYIISKSDYDLSYDARFPATHRSILLICFGIAFVPFCMDYIHKFVLDNCNILAYTKY